MNMENPFKKHVQNQEVDTGWVDLAEGRIGGDENAEASPATIEQEESRLEGNMTRLQEAVKKPVAEGKLQEPDTRGKIEKAWQNAKLHAMEAFTALLGATAGAVMWTGESYDAAQAAMQNANMEDYVTLTERVSLLQTADTTMIAATLAVPLVMLGMSKLSKMRRERNLYK